MLPYPVPGTATFYADDSTDTEPAELGETGSDSTGDAHMAQTHVLAKHLDNHGHLTGPEHDHLIATFPVDAYESLWESKGWVLVNSAGEPVPTLEDADPERQAQPEDAVDRRAARADLARKFTRTPGKKTEKAEG